MVVGVEKKTFGKYKTPEQFWKNYDEYREMGISKVSCTKLLGLSPKSLYRRLAERLNEN